MRARSFLSIAAPAVIVLCAAFPYLEILHAPFQYDDWFHIVENPAMHVTRLAPSGLWNVVTHNINATRPFTYLTLALNYYAGGMDTWGYHAVNLGLHLAAAITLYGLVVTTLTLPALVPHYGPAAHRIALTAALLWAVHPVQIQAVTYIIQRFTSQEAFGALLALLGYVKGRLGYGWRQAAWWTLACLAAGLALGSKETAFVLPLSLAAYEGYFLSGPLTARTGFSVLTAGRRRAWVYGGVLLLCVETSLALAYLWGGNLGGRVDQLSQAWTGPWEHAMTQGRVLISYLSLLILPHPSRLTILHDVPISHSLFDPPTTTFAAGMIVAWIGTIVWTARRATLVSFGLSWTLLHLALEAALPLLPMFEYRLYLPSVGIALIAALGWNRVWEAAGSRHGLGSVAAEAALAGCLIVTLVGLTAWTRQVNRLWLDELSLWADAARKAPTDARPLVYVGKAYWLRGQPERAREAIATALRLQPAFHAAHLIQGHLHLEAGDLERAVESYRAALRFRPDYPEAWYHLGVAYGAQGRPDVAGRAYRAALLVRPLFPQAGYNLGLTEWLQGRQETAIATVRSVIAYAPDFAEAHNGLGVMYGEAGRLDEAIGEFQRAVALKPSYTQARHNLDLAYERISGRERVIAAPSR